MSQQQVAEQAGLSKMSISKYENERMLPSSDALIRFAGALGQPVEFFLRGPVTASVTPVYRGRKTLHGKHEAAVIAQIQEWLERYLAAESLSRWRRWRFRHPDGFPCAVTALWKSRAGGAAWVHMRHR